VGMTAAEFERRLRQMGIDPDDLGEAVEQRGEIELERIRKTYRLGQDDLKNRYQIASMESGDRRANIEMERERARADVELAREEMERIGIPSMEIDRFIALANKEIALGELSYKREALEEDRRQFGLTLTEEQRQFNQEFGMDERKFGEDIRRFDTEFGEDARRYNQDFGEDVRRYNQDFGEDTRRFGLEFGEGQRQFNAQFGLDERKFAEDTRRYGLEHALAEAGLTGMYNGLPTLEKQAFEEGVRQFGLNYALEVADRGIELSKTSDTYFQAQRFAGMDLPRLMGGAAAGGPGPAGGPTAQITTLGARLGQSALPAGATGAGLPQTPVYGGATPSQPTFGAAPAPGQPGIAADGQGVVGSPTTPDDDRAKQVAQIVSAAIPVRRPRRAGRRRVAAD
jgi:hypothetical protein